MNTEDMIRKVLEIEAENPVYRTGGTGADGTCDCIGAVMGALYRLGHAKLPLHSSNYFARYETRDLHEIADAHELLPGQVVYKAEDDSHDLHERYLPGGTHFTGDTRDYYHAGVVISASPLVIVHCTSSGAVNGFTRDSRLGGWRFAGTVRGVGQEEQAIVTVPSGATANLRIRPTKQSRRIAKVPAGTAVTMLAQADGWTKIRLPDGTQGYMMTVYLTTGRTLEDRLADLERRVAALEGGKP